MYEYKIASVARIIDGDTYDLDLDLGFYAILRIRCRLKGLDTPEVYGRYADDVRGPAATEAAREWFERTPNAGVRTEKANWDVPVSQGAFGRWLGEVFDLDTGEKLADALREGGHEK